MAAPSVPGFGISVASGGLMLEFMRERRYYKKVRCMTLYRLRYIHFLCLMLLLASCGKYKVEDDGPNGGDTPAGQAECLLSVRIGSKDNAQIVLPVSLFVFDSDGNCVVDESLSRVDDDYSVSLPKGEYTVIALSGLSGSALGYPFLFTPASYISLTDVFHMPVPLQTGKVSVSLSRSATAHVTLAYAVAALNFQLYGIPEEAQSVTVRVSPVSSGMTFEGDCRNDAREAVIECHRQGNRWVSDEAYVFPSASSQTRLSVNVALPGKEEAYGYTYPSVLRAGTPYHFTGTYADAITLDGQFQCQGWSQVIDVEFGFDSIVPISPEDPDDPSVVDPGVGTAEIAVAELPEVKDIWKECLICQVQKLSATSCKAVIIANDYMSMQSWYLADYLESFSYSGLSGWRVFTTDEATAFRDTYYGTHTVSELNTYLLSNDVEPFKYENGARYLCNGGESSFSFVSKTISAAGEKKSYYVRPVKDVVFTVR